MEIVQMNKVWHHRRLVKEPMGAWEGKVLDPTEACNGFAWYGHSTERSGQRPEALDAPSERDGEIVEIPPPASPSGSRLMMLKLEDVWIGRVLSIYQ